MAEGLFREMVRERPEITVSSAGVSAATGQPASQNAVAVLRRQGIDLTTFRSRPLSDAVIAKATHIFAMTHSHRDLILTFFPEAAERTFLLCDFHPQNPGADLPDPFGQGVEVYARCCEKIKEALPSVLAHIEKKPTA